MTTDKYLGYRGRIGDLQGHGGTVYFVTVHPEGQPTALYALDGEKLELAETPLPAGGTALAIDAGGKGGLTVWVGGSDRHVYRVDGSKKPKAIGGEFTEEIVAVAPLPRNQLAVVAGAALFILNTKDDVLSTLFELPEAGSALAVDPTGEWVVVGTEGGTVLVFESEGRDEFIQSESAKLHDAAVTALLFEPEELRFYSAGADNKLLLTHARGTLEPEDRGRGNSHTDRLTGLVLVGEDRFLSGGRDGTLKSWVRGGGTRPATVKDGVVAVTGLTRITVHNRQRAVASGHDNTLRLFPLDAAGKIGELSARIHDAYDRAAHEFSDGDPARREKSLKELAGYADLRSLELIHKQATADGDAALRRLATELLGASGNGRVVEWLEKLLKHDDEAVRRAALAGLRALLGENDLRPLDLALKVKKADVGVEAVRALEGLAGKDDQALARLVAALDFNPPEVRQSALAALENVQPKDSPEADLAALRSKHVDTRRVALIRLYQRGLLGQPRVRAALRRASEDAHADVRQAAVLVSILSSEPLATALRAREPELHRHLAEIESFTFAPTEGGKAKKREGGTQETPAEPSSKTPKQPAATKKQLELSDADREPLLEAMASRAVDTSLAGAMCLALLGDARALGLLLQLSREADAAARVVVCRALASLDDRRAEDRLRTLLDDGAAEVRDAAFTALEAIYESAPIEAARAGLSASEKDVRGRGLKVLLKLLRGKPKADERAVIESWLVRALNDRDPAVRTEAYKACLNAKVGGDEAGTLRFVLQSIHADVRREVLTEVMAEHKRPWAQDLLFELFDDPDPTLRKEAFEFAAKKADKKDYESYERALASRFAGVRAEAVAALVRRGTKVAQKLLAGAIEDKDLEVRQRALEALVDADARDVLTKAMQSQYVDVQLRAARARARMGDGDALPVLRTLATQKEPQEKVHQEAWRAVTAEALIGLGELGDPTASAVAVQKLDSPHAEIRKAAATALVGMARPQTVPALKLVLQHDDEQVRHRVALALAFAGDPTGESIVYSQRAAGTLTGAERLAASVTLPESDERMAAFLDEDEAALRRSALLVLMLRDDRTHDGTPRHLLACLAARHPRVRLIAADALEAFPDPETYREFLTRTVNDRGDEAAWTVPRSAVETLSQILAVGEPPLVARAVLLLPLLSEEKQHRWDLAWSAFTERHADELKQVAQHAGKLKTPKIASTPEELWELAFGTYVGLVREAGGSHAQNVRVRQTAIRRLVELAGRDECFQSAAVPVLTQSLGDPAQAVRFQAFDALRALGRDAQQLGTEALETGHEDLGERGLQLLTEGMSDAAGRKALEEVVTTRTDELALVAARLLRERHDPVAVAAAALEAVSENVRLSAVRWLAADIDPSAGSDIDPKRSKQAKKALEAALGSRYRAVRRAAAVELARKQDAAAFAALVELLGSSRESAEQSQLIAAMEELGDGRGPGALLDRMEHDTTGSVPAAELIRAAGRFRQPASVDRMLALMPEERFKPQRRLLFEAVHTVSGYDQPDEDRTALDDADELLAVFFGPRPEREPLDGMDSSELKQHPRHPDLLAKLMRSCLDLGELRWLRELIEPARRSKGSDVDPVFAQLTVHADDELRRAAVEAYGWRVRRRGASAEPLKKALEHKDPPTKFYAAEALARAGHADGAGVLLSAVELMTDVADRQRAVAALGELADERALDVLLRIAAEDAHALQEAAVEALGHMGQSDKADEIFKLLERFARNAGGLAQRAIRGLRWFDTPSGWQLVRERAGEDGFFWQDTAVEMLGFNDDPATRDLLLKLIADDTFEHADEAVRSARRLCGPDSLEPDYALLARGDVDPAGERWVVERVCERGEPGRIIELIPKCESESTQQMLVTSLLRREDVPVDAAAAQLDSRDATAVQTAAHLLGRAGQVTKKQADALAAALRRWRAKWHEERQKPQPRWGGHPVSQVTPALRRLVWAAGRLGAATDDVVELSGERGGDVLFAPVRLEAVRALATMPPTDAVLDALAAAAVGPDPEVRHAAAQSLADRGPQRAAALAGQLLADRASLQRLTKAEGIDVTATLETVAAQVHYQGVALPELIAAADLDGLQEVARNRELPETTRLGAIEAIGRLGSEPAETTLAEIGANEKNDEPIRKEAWRARRRSIRLRTKAVV